MDSSINYSRLSKTDSQAFRSTGISLIFKTVSRDVKPTWSNRIVKDVNDLTYNINIDYFGKGRFKSINIENKNKIFNKNSTIQPKLSPREKRSQLFSSKLPQPLSKSLFLKKCTDPFSFNPEQKTRKTNRSTIQTYGLSSFQYKNTIDGKVKNKPNMHLKFINQVDRKGCESSIWYNKDFEIDLQKYEFKRYRRALDKYHAFQSYTDRSLFSDRDKIDKIYEVESAQRRTSIDRVKRTVPLSTVPGRKDPPARESGRLSYMISDEAMNQCKERSPKYSMRRTVRQLEIGRQVINDKRGCCR